MFSSAMTAPHLIADRFRPWVKGASLLAAAIGAAASISHIANIAGFFRIFAAQPPIQLSTAIAFLACAAALQALLAVRHQLARGLAAVGLVIGLATLLEYLIGVNLGVDIVLPVMAELETAEVFPGRMSAAVALCVVMVGAAILELSSLRPKPEARKVAGVLGSITTVLAVLVLCGYATNLLAGLRFNYVTAMPVAAALALFGLGSSIVLAAWHHPTALSAFPAWVPAGAGAGVLVATLLLAGGLSIAERDRAMEQVAQQSAAVRYLVTDRVEETLRPLRQLGTFTDSAGSLNFYEWTTLARRALTTPGIVAIEWVGDDFVPRAQTPSALWSRLAPRELGTLFAAWPVDQRRRADAAFLVSIASPPMLIAAVPACAAVRCNGVTLAVLEPGRLLTAILDNSSPGYQAEVDLNGLPVYPERRSERSSEWMVDADTVALGLRWTVRIRPESQTLSALVSELPTVVAGLGFIVSALLVATLQLVQSSFTMARRAERDRIATAIEGFHEGIWELSLPSGEGVRSPGLWRQLGLDPDKVSAHDGPRVWNSMIHPDDRNKLGRAVSDHVAGRTESIDVEYRIEGREGWHWMTERGRTVEWDERQQPSRLLGTVSDVTDRKHAAEQLASSERRFRAVFNSGFQFESLLDLECNVIESNQTSLEFGGLAIEDVQGRPFWAAGWWTHSAVSQERLRDACRDAASGKTVQYQDEVRGAHDRRALIDFSLKPIVDADGRVVQLLAEGRDITERKRAEDAVREMDSLGAIGRMAARVAHEINNPLAGIQNSFLLIKDAVPPSHPYFSYVGAIEREIARIASVTRQLYESFRPESDSTSDSSVAVVISDAVTMLKQVNRAAQVSIEVDTSRAPPIMAIPSPLLRQTVYNLVQNAVEASPPGGTVRVAAWRDGDIFWLAVADQGPGVPVEMRERIFEPFISTKRGLATAGMGLGLSLVRRSVQAMGGWIEVDDGADGGAEFRVRLPIT